MASRIVERFGDKTLEVIDQRIDELGKVEGIGQKRIGMIKKAWEDQKDIREVMIFLQAHGVSAGHGAKIFRRYGHDAVSVLKRNPYRLATDIYGIGFNLADRIAEKLRFDKSAPVRAEAGILYVLKELSDEGHVYYPYELLIDKCREILGVDREVIIKAFGQVSLDGKIVAEDLNLQLEEFAANEKAVYLAQITWPVCFLRKRRPGK
jgi:exodeoxyribonuclease V alpha subunit